ncbi:DUF6191 domain-containing protein [Amycolatopsis sp. WQ 127309]|uniref:DUF6191 domain-containing protein n=1 Tax=Amycolatopsis sp. WQ 127309 TaxID=2932773 RepID=UPI001FF65B83|nr:DUF6191 domain-containing protein [Amycolatopsis sp. WQ 127309]UOZ06867.1 DUF6191 domain-containing protein [Amycolatopsis sp. WQ 127309]
MGTWLGLALPGGVVILLVMAAIELRPRKNGSRFKARLSATYVEETTAFLYGTKRRELEHRETMSMLVEQDADGAPPRRDVDLDAGTAVLRPRPAAREPGNRELQ